MSLLITDDILKQANMSEAEFKLELAIFLYVRQILSSGKASEFAGLPRPIFQLELAKRKIAISYDQEEFDKDMAMIKRKYAQS